MAKNIWLIISGGDKRAPKKNIKINAIFRWFIRMSKGIIFNLIKIKSKSGLIKTQRIERNTRSSIKTYSFNFPSKCIFIEDIVLEVSLLIKKCHMIGIIKKYVIKVLIKKKKKIAFFILIMNKASFL